MTQTKSALLISHFLFVTRDNLDNSIAVLNDELIFCERLKAYIDTALDHNFPLITEVWDSVHAAIEDARDDDLTLVVPIRANLHTLFIRRYLVSAVSIYP